MFSIRSKSRVRFIPRSAESGKSKGEVDASILVSETGTVEYIRPTMGDDTLASAAREVILKWKFKPLTVDGNVEAAVAKVSFNFSLTDQSQIAQAVPPDIAPAMKFPARVRVSQGVSTGLILTKVNPVYPADAKAAHIQGSVILHATISKEGTVEDLQLISGPPELVAATTKAVKQWRYRPYLLMGRPIPVDTQIQVNLTLSRP